ncbi:hypothetical protein JOE44_001963 [Chryseobacterium sp. PvR013]|uniref:hypothetical protein n=1 Tax=Chryseobacterium sp. PvR013 TaxID=2806595 RepID=UPI001AE2D5B0|nr:hypothetical protein [Chryseobacterium sp. PvR013]MBP1165079.1 hypothetical protein [Chryseobacterium sp. PvR013]
MNLEGRKSNIYFDKTGKQILEGDLLQVFHFRTKGKIYYMYHVAMIEETKDFPVMALRAHYSIKPHYRLFQVCDNEQRVYYNAKIIGERDYQTERLKIKLK